MPVILDPADYAVWLDPANSDRERLAPLLVPLGSFALIADPVSTHVNNPRHEDEQCIEVISNL
jgi:putative SOS response-associated peptidase YedK